MKKLLLLFIVFTLTVLAFAGCEKTQEHVHEWQEASCSSPKTCCCGVTDGEPLGHDLLPADCLSPAACSRCNHTEGEPLGHDLTDANCLGAAACKREGCDFSFGQIGSHVLECSYEDGELTYGCKVCDKAQSIDNFVFLDGTDHKNMRGVANNGKNTTEENSDLPLIKNGAYELINIGGDGDQFQIWVPSLESDMEGFSSGNFAVGFISFSIDIYTDKNFSLRLVDTSADAQRWSEEWCVGKNFLSVSPPYGINGEIGVSFFGWNDVQLYDVMIDVEKKFTGWVDVIVGIILDPNTDTVILRYYINGEYCGSSSNELTTVTNAINSVYFNGNSSTLGSGMRFDNIAFGYSANSEWMFDYDDGEHRHEFCDATCTEPKKCKTCSAIGSQPLGHSLSEAEKNVLLLPTCTEHGSYNMVATCKICNQTVTSEPLLSEPTGHKLAHSYVDSVLTYGCAECGMSFSPKTFFFLDGSGYSGMTGVLNNTNYTTEDGTQLPIINENGEYELINKTGALGQTQIWIPKNAPAISGFSSQNRAFGFFSFGIDAYMTKGLSMKFIDTSSEADRWSKEWCITESFFNISSPQENEDGIYVTVSGWDGIVFAVIKVDEQNPFTGRLDVKISILLDPDSDTVTLGYYINSEFKGSATKALTTSTNAINSVYISGNSDALGSGLKLSDVAFGYTDEGCFESKPE